MLESGLGAACQRVHEPRPQGPGPLGTKFLFSLGIPGGSVSTVHSVRSTVRPIRRVRSLDGPLFPQDGARGECEEAFKRITEAVSDSGCFVLWDPLTESCELSIALSWVT